MTYGYRKDINWDAVWESIKNWKIWLGCGN